jgi:tetraacyldisaccharide 4'-kinase
MGVYSFIVKLLYRKTLLTYLLLPFSLVISSIYKLRRAYYLKHPEKIYQPQTRIISVGNIMIGGSGKTPFTIYLAELIKNMGYSVAVSHRGYKTKFEHDITLISTKLDLLPQAYEAGDEPLLIADKLKGVPVIVGKNRTKAIKALLDIYPRTDFVILDDSFQHLAVSHHHDFVLFKEAVNLHNSYVFPAGPFRESISALKHCDSLVSISPAEICAPLAAENEKKDPTFFWWGALLPALAKQQPKNIIPASFQIQGFWDSNQQAVDHTTLSKSRIALISAIGQPASFEQTVTSAGLKFVQHYIFPDHFSFNDHKSLQAVSKDKDNKYDLILTTEKDWTKLQKYASSLPFVVVKIAFVPADPNQIEKIIKRLIA